MSVTMYLYLCYPVSILNVVISATMHLHLCYPVSIWKVVISATMHLHLCYPVSILKVVISASIYLHVYYPVSIFEGCYICYNVFASLLLSVFCKMSFLIQCSIISMTDFISFVFHKICVSLLRIQYFGDMSYLLQ